MKPLRAYSPRTPKSMLIGSGAILVAAAAGLGFYLWNKPKNELSVLVERNLILDKIFTEQAQMLEDLAGVELKLQTFAMDEALDSDTIRAHLEFDLVIATNATLAQWKEKQWLRDFTTDAKDQAMLVPSSAFRADERASWALPAFAFDLPLLASTRDDVKESDIASLFSREKSMPNARFEVTYGSDQKQFFMNMLINSRSLKIPVDQSQQTIVWDANLLKMTLENYSEAMHLKVTTPIFCERDCPQTELGRGNASFAWVNQATGMRISQDLQARQHKDLQAIKSLQPLKGKGFSHLALMARPRLATPDANAWDSTQKLMAAVLNPKFQDQLASYGALPVEDRLSYWSLENYEAKLKFENRIMMSLQNLASGSVTLMETRELLLKSAP